MQKFSICCIGTWWTLKAQRDYWDFDAEVQFLANRDMLCSNPTLELVVDMEKKFLNASDLQWGN